MDSNTFRLVLMVVVMSLFSGSVSGYRTSRYRTGRSFLNKNSYGRPSMYTPKSRYTHYSQGLLHPHPHPHGENAIGLPISLHGDIDDDMDAVNRFMPYGYQDSYLIPLEALLRDMAGYTGYKAQQLPHLVRNIKHEFYIGANKADPILHAILKRYGFQYTGASGLGFGNTGGVNDIFSSIGLGGAGANAYGGLGASTGITSAQSPLPGSTGINDNLFNEFDNGLLGLSGEASPGTAAILSDDPQPMTGSDATTNTDNAATGNDVLGL